MTLRERILAVYRGETPDVAPFMLDLSHWFLHKTRAPWNVSQAYTSPDTDLVGYHRDNGVGFYIANLAAFYEAEYPDDVSISATQEDTSAGREIVWRIETPLGTIQRRRVWSEETYAWAISSWGVSTPQDLRVLAYALGACRYRPRWDNYRAWSQEVGDLGVVYMSTGYSAIGQLMNYWMGIENTVFATVDFPDVLEQSVEAINGGALGLVDLVATSPAEVVIMGDNFSGDVQPPSFFDRWSRPYYEEAVRRLHAAGKCVAVHIDGRLRGAIEMIRGAGADCADAITPTPMGDLTPAQCRAEAGPRFILSGGVGPDLWLPNVPVEVFKSKVIEWLALRHESPRLIAAAGDQVPPGADEDRIAIMRDLVEEHGRY